MSLPSKACALCVSAKVHQWARSSVARLDSGFEGVEASRSYLGEDGGPDGLDVGDVGSLDQGLELVGL